MLTVFRFSHATSRPAYQHASRSALTMTRLLGWTATLFAIQSWLSETPAQNATASSSGYVQVLMALLSLAVVRLSKKTTKSKRSMGTLLFRTPKDVLVSTAAVPQSFLLYTDIFRQGYMPLFLPPVGQAPSAGSGTAPPAPSP